MDFKTIDTALTDLMERKNKAYGNAYKDNYEAFGTTYAAIEVFNKVNRIKTLVKNPDISDNGEHLFDSFVDLRNYAELAIKEMIERKEVPTDVLAKYKIETE
ncbi:hypothetical protein [Lactobacillus mulieris]|uniref:DUF1599 domain-containing protein n=1 Tax=Lactobacillus mulieris TaxID=2508708 RepID=A0AAP3GVI9_9LACO|nr:hypothetical protein [Lactobacillus mulieris]MCW8123431.1 hypothetical protein [Lactobacillus mulieris]MCZ3844142.1 hypothetical protein [Lactobacillus mulieris]MCZ3875802.1 hypothetical protein [Lactobacillus mulieris]MDK7326594.1 hypothetical protein [Lactobacillus mulieris]